MEDFPALGNPERSRDKVDIERQIREVRIHGVKNEGEGENVSNCCIHSIISISKVGTIHILTEHHHCCVPPLTDHANGDCALLVFDVVQWGVYQRSM